MYACGDNTDFCCDTDGVYHSCCNDANNFLKLGNITQQTTVGVLPSSTATSTPTSKSSPSPTFKPPKDHTVAIAVGVAVPVGVIGLALISGLCFWRRRRRQTKLPPPAPPYPPPVPMRSDSSNSWNNNQWNRQSDVGYYKKVAPEAQEETPILIPQELPSHIEMQELDGSKPTPR